MSRARDIADLQSGAVAFSSTISLTDSDVAHGMTGLLPTATYGQLATESGTEGGVRITTATEGATAYSVTATSTTPSTDGDGAVFRFRASKKSGTSEQALADADDLMTIGNVGVEKITIKGNGDTTFGGSIVKTAGSGTFTIETSGSSSVNLNASSSMKFTVGGSDSHQFVNGSDTVLVIDSSGKTGMNVTSPSGILHVKTPTGTSGSNNTVKGLVVQEGGFSTANILEIQDSVGGEYMVVDGSGNVAIGSSNPQNLLHLEASAGARMRFVDTGTQAYTLGNSGTSLTINNESQSTTPFIIDSSGNVGIGTSPSAKLDVLSDSSNTDAESDLGVYHRFLNSNTGLNTGSAITLGSNSNSGAAIYAQRVGSNNEHKMGFQVRNSSGSSTTRMTLSGDGSVSILGTTTVGALNSYSTLRAGNTGRLNLEPSGNLTISFGGDSDSSYYAAIFANNSSSAVGYILVGSSATDYSTSSDYRLKENINYDWDATSRLKQLKPARFNFKTEPDKTIDGLIAHEVSEIVPNAVNGEKDEMKNGKPFYQGIDHSKLVPLLTKSLQEAMARIETLEAKVAKLEGE